ncbi:sugar transferase [Lentisalinibacter orientalis]|uniref:sugar transferase n=1 Tax=Lentisalinibacter orientalis TaxID=2992241 RepID=UPI003869CA0E
MIRFLDILLSALGLIVASPLLIVLILAGLLDTGMPFFRQRRVGQDQKPFTLIKFRTMKPETREVGTHLADTDAVTPLGRVLRRSKLDELPQLWNVLKGDMSLVGPRPCLLAQEELILERVNRGVFDVRPGITGLSQIRGIDMSTPVRLAETDAQMLESLSVSSYLRYILATVLGKGSGDRVRT